MLLNTKDYRIRPPGEEEHTQEVLLPGGQVCDSHS